MGVREYVPFTDGGTDSVHYGCRECGTNLDEDHRSCPDCGGGVVAYDL
jgi:rRNA maturation endonuclease Nob1